jgi:ABC-type multidrug transport system ATPase subunit
MQITLHNAGKRYNYEWIFRQLNFQFTSGNTYAVLGANGSGKSTLLQCISTYKLLSEGKILFNSEGRELAYSPLLVSMSAPYLELIEEYTIAEIYRFQAYFKPFQKEINYKRFIEITGLIKHQHKPIKQFSSGMKQRVKLSLAVLSNSPVLLLDEPTSNLDNDGVNWYLELITGYKNNRIVLIGSNDEREYAFCDSQISMHNYKT